MRLENLYQNFGESSPEAQAQYVTEYRQRRAIDMDKTPSWPKIKTTTSTKSPKLILTPEEETVRKLLNLTKKQIISMRSLKEN